MPLNKPILLVLIVLLPVFGFADIKSKSGDRTFIPGETLNYKAKWGMLTIGSATTKVDKKLYKIGSKLCAKIQLSGTTNGLARLFYLKDRWVSYIDVSNITTLKAFRQIREGHYKLDEFTSFDHTNKKADIQVLNYQTGKFVLKKVYKTPENIRDVVAGFMMIRIIDFSKYKIDDKIIIDGFYEDTGYKIEVIMAGKEMVKTDKGNVLCYKLKPLVPKNRVFEDVDAVEMWVSANKIQCIVSIHAKLVFGSLWIELQN